MRLQGQRDIFQCRKAGENTGDLEGACQSQSGTPGHRQRCDIASREVNMSSVRAHLASQLANQGRLASAVGTDDGMEFTGPLHFVQFWLDTVADWQRETGRTVLVGLSCTKDVQDAVLAEVLGERELHENPVDRRIGICSAEGCANVYVDTSRNASRRYCSNTCASRSTVAAYRARQKS